MADVRAALVRRGLRWADPASAVILAAATAAIGHRWWTDPAWSAVDMSCAVGACLPVWWRRRSPLVVAVATAALTLAPFLNAGGARIYAGPTSGPGLAAMFLVAMALGSRSPWPRSLLGLVPLTAAAAVTDGPRFNPFLVVIVVGPWLVGLVLASRQRAADQLARRARELTEEREAFAATSVRYERARIARELHDIVAHNVCMMVVQANAGSFLVDQKPEAAAEAFAAIDAAGRQAREEVGRLAVLLDEEPPNLPGDLRVVEDIIDTAQRSGLRISYELRGEAAELSVAAGDVIHKVIREAITNAVKHAAGAAVEVTVESGSDATSVKVHNGPSAAADRGLTAVGGGHGLAGMRERIERLGGLLDAGPDGCGGWLVTARIPSRLEPLAQPLAR